MERVLGRYAVMVWADGMHSYVMHQEVLCIITILMIATLLWIIEALFHSVEWTLPKSAKTKFSSVESRLQSENMKRNKKRNGSASQFFCITSFFLHHKFFVASKVFFCITFFFASQVVLHQKCADKHVFVEDEQKHFHCRRSIIQRVLIYTHRMIWDCCEFRHACM